MSNAVLFFDECETVFRSRLVLCPCTDNYIGAEERCGSFNAMLSRRDRGGDRLLNSLLTEIEKHEGRE
jgi:hypothetical protein